MKELRVTTDEISVPNLLPGRNYDTFVGQTDNGIVALFDSTNHVTDCFQLKFDESDGNVDGMTLIKTIKARLKIVIGVADKLLLDNEVYERVS